MPRTPLCFAILATIAVAAPVAAQNNVCPTGDPALLRISKIKPGGSMAGLAKAVADHSKWYADHGFTADRQVIAPVLVPGPQGPHVASDQVMTLHLHAHNVPQNQHDAGWDAFVAEYRANSEVVSEMMVCLPPIN
ncbi:hypothetical protein [Sphingomonas nostoxanthinifaciens]|uniref:hypothetical protein n=1 Tax=Sphingomonas nostoxanthinifaciens TaxID=2872652 RepID=UPI001CC21896|nr:hypothetical protein [Sphingomonas nostoxanthinifaciens]UAK23017.1 hypothetical protein K8P63_11310 [Sphingomonas nostoxanthinifaciens]